MTNNQIRYVMNSITGFMVEGAMLIAIYHIWGWVSLFWTALVLTLLQSIGIYTFAERNMRDAQKRESIG